MKRLILAGAIAACATIFSGCGFVFVARSASYPVAPTAPVYCHECRYVPMGRAAYARCGHYEIRVARNGYYYRPLRRHGHVEFRFVKFDHFSRIDSGKHAHGENRHERRSRR